MYHYLFYPNLISVIASITLIVFTLIILPLLAIRLRQLNKGKNKSLDKLQDDFSEAIDIALDLAGENARKLELIDDTLEKIDERLTVLENKKKK